MLPTSVTQILLSMGETIQNVQNVSGGCINNGKVVSTTKRKLFIKWNDNRRFPKMFEAELNGLQLLASTGVKTPKVYRHFNDGHMAGLMMEFITSGLKSRQSMALLGQQLAQIHQAVNETYGLNHYNYMGGLRQTNNIKVHWHDFYITQRLQPQVKMARDASYLTNNDLQLFESFYKKIPTLFPEESPVLIHGDFWNGNYMISDNGIPVFIDPAVAYAHREVDLAMTYLFGGFDTVFYDAYQESLPLQPGFMKRKDAYNIYPLLVHLNLFGTGYYKSVIHAVNQYL